MSNFKSGSGNLDFGGGDEDDESSEPAPKSTEETAQTDTESNKGDESTASEQAAEDSQQAASSGTDSTTNSPAEGNESTQESTAATANKQYPYFIRRNNVGDERDTRLEIHVRDKVADHEAAFRNEVAEQLNANEVSKTDAREFALLAAFQHPERVAELMAQEGFGTLG